MNVNIGILDCTLRDGGYVNAHGFTLAQALDIVDGLARSGIDAIEIGYLRRRKVDAGFGPAASCPDSYIAALSKHKGRARLVAMVHTRDLEPSVFAGLPSLGLDGVRFPIVAESLGNIRPYVDAARKAGLWVGVNIIRASRLSSQAVAQLAREVQGMGADVVYFADSNGALFPEEVAERLRAARNATTTPLGFHAHDNLHLGSMNALAAIEAGATWLDATLGGMGKGAGNARTEVLSLYLFRKFGRRFDQQLLAETAVRNLSPWLHPRHLELCENGLTGHLDLDLGQIDNLRATLGNAPGAILSALQERIVGSSEVSQPLPNTGTSARV